MASPKRVRQVSYRISALIAFPLLVATTGAIIVINSQVAARSSARHLGHALCDDVAQQIATDAGAYVDRADRSADSLALLLSNEVAVPSVETLAPILIATLVTDPSFQTVTFTDEAGHTTSVHYAANHDIVVDESRIENDKRVKDSFAWITAGGASALTSIETKHGEGDESDPRKKPTYTTAIAMKKRVLTAPDSNSQGNVAFATVMPVYTSVGGLRGVVDVDFDLAGLDENMQNRRPSERAQLFVYGAGDAIFVPKMPSSLYSIPGSPSFTDAVRGYFAARSQDEFEAAGKRYFAATRKVQVAEGITWSVGVLAPESDFLGEIDRATRLSLALVFLSFAVAMALSIWLATRFVTAFSRIVREMEKIGRFELRDPDPHGSVFTEMTQMDEALASMKRGLASFAFYVPRDLVRSVMASGQPAVLGGKKKEMTIFFSDLTGFSKLAATLSPAELVRFLGNYFDEMSNVIADRRGTVDKFIGDAITAFWNAPKDEKDHAALACEAALNCQKKLVEMKAKDETLASLSLRVGVASGEVLVGNIGSHDRISYTVMGESADLAARLESLGKLYGASILVSEACYLAARHRVVMRAVDVVAVASKSESVRIYEPIACVRDGDEAAELWSRLSLEAFDAYLAREWVVARDLFEKILASHPGDVAATMLRDRCDQLATAPPPVDWTGVVVMRET